MKFMSSFQCLMGGNGVQFQNSSSSSSSSSSLSSSVVCSSQSSSLDDITSSSSSMNSSSKIHSKKMKKKKKNKKDRKVIKVFKPDGVINVYEKPIKVSEVMTQDFMVCRSDSFYIGQKIPPLSQHDRLQPGHTYFLLPTRLFHSVLSFVTIASFANCQQHHQDQLMDDDDHSNANNMMKMKAAFLKKAAASSCSPFDIQKTSSGTLRIRVSELFISQLMMDQHQPANNNSNNNNNHKNEEEEEELMIDDDLLCTTPQLHREYKQLVVGSRRGWKPKLEMIKEIPPPPIGNKRKVKMLLSASITRIKTKLNKNNSSSSSASHLIKMNKKKMKKKTKKMIKPPPAASIKSNKSSKIK